MKISLVMATVNRTDEVTRFLEHLGKQTYRDFELIVIDQNQDDRLQPILAPYLGAFPVFHIKSSQRGAARARNLGMANVSGEIIGFPDDDCWYAPDLLDQVLGFFTSHPEWDGLTGRATDLNGITLALHFDDRGGAVTRYNVLKRSLTFTTFYRRAVTEAVDGFDEQLGVGAGTPWGSGEETDYLIQAMDRGFRILYDPSFMVYHPDPLKSERDKLLQRGYSYGCGLGKMLRKNDYPFWFFIYYLIRSLGGALLALGRGDRLQCIYYWETTRGRIYGWRNG